MITAYRSDTIRKRHSNEYDNDRSALGGLADCVVCSRCLTAYSFFFLTERHTPEAIRKWARTIIESGHPSHIETFIRIPENPKDGGAQGFG